VGNAIPDFDPVPLRLIPPEKMKIGGIFSDLLTREMKKGVSF
jgi:hypothetical protein